MKIEMDGGVSKTAGLIVAILTIVSVICGAVFWIVHQNDMLQAQIMVAMQQISNNTAAIKEENEKRQQDEKNFDDVLIIMGKMHEGK